jgi:hypothetical protein
MVSGFYCWEAWMKKRLILRGFAITALLMAAAAPVCAALEGGIDFSGHARPGIDFSAVTASVGGNGADCEPVYMPTLVHERDGSIVGMTYVLEGDDC